MIFYTMDKSNKYVLIIYINVNWLCVHCGCNILDGLWYVPHELAEPTNRRKEKMKKIQ